MLGEGTFGARQVRETDAVKIEFVHVSYKNRQTGAGNCGWIMVRKVCYKCDEMRYGRLGLNMVWDIDVTVQGEGRGR